MSKLGFGGWGIGGNSTGALSYGAVDENTALAAIEVALNAGINFFDTSPAYGGGISESLLGIATQSRREKVVLATKVGMGVLGNEKNFTLEAVERSIENSLKRLQTNYIDVLQLHDPEPQHSSEIKDILDLIEEYKIHGKIRFGGISLKTPTDFDFWSELGNFDYIQVNFSALDQRVLATDIPNYCMDTGARVIARTPLCFGFLSDHFPKRELLDQFDHRLRWDTHQFSCWERAADSIFSGFSIRSKTELSIRYCLSFQWVSTVIAGIISPREAEENASIAKLGPLSEHDLVRIQKNYKEAVKHLPALIKR
jgi:aryl-alcohol dehydrogenase-like predicted oxidoreductase